MNSSSDLTKYNQSDGKTVLESADDAASQIMGSDWRMPTRAEFDELLSGTTNEWVEDFNGTGVNGYKFTSNKEGYQNNSIFIPAAGYCGDGGVDNVGNGGGVWSSSLNTSSSDSAWFLNFGSGYCNMSSDGGRCGGQSVRGVRK